MAAAREPMVKEAARAFADARAAAAHVGKAAKALRERAPDMVEETRRALKGRSRDARRQAGAAAALAEAELHDLRAAAGEHAETLKGLFEDGFRGRPVTTVLAAAGAGFFLGVLLTGRRG